jgi:tRNA threonylcarbamoyl adenosine modification protein YeaZ
MELAIDTSSNIVSIALSHRGEILASLTWRTMQNHTVELLPNLICLLQKAKVGLDTVEAVIVAKGPGSFNGLRVGVSTAKGLASALDIPLLGVSTLEADAYLFAFTGLPVRPIHKAGGEEIATALYRQEADEWQCLETESLATVEALCRRIEEKTLFCGEIPPDIIGEIQQKLGNLAVISRSNSFCRASCLAMLGWRELSKGKRDDPVTLQPVYLRPPHITKPREKIPPGHSPAEKGKSDHGNPEGRC